MDNERHHNDSGDSAPVLRAWADIATRQADEVMRLPADDPSRTTALWQTMQHVAAIERLLSADDPLRDGIVPSPSILMCVWLDNRGPGHRRDAVPVRTRVRPASPALGRPHQVATTRRGMSADYANGVNSCGWVWRPREHLRRRGIATRYEETATIYLAGPHIAGIPLVRPLIQTQPPSRRARRSRIRSPVP